VTLGSSTLTRLVGGAAIEVAWNDGELYVRRGEDLMAQPFDPVTAANSGDVVDSPRVDRTMPPALPAATDRPSATRPDCRHYRRQ
jgi:hypothetical protein